MTKESGTRLWPWMLLYAAMTVVLLFPLSLAPHRLLPDDGDAVQNLWIIWWGATHLDAGYPGIYDANAYHPHSQALVYSEPQLSQALLSWPLFRFLDNHVLAYNSLMALSLVLTALGMHLFLREFVKSSEAASVGAVLFTFSSYGFSQLPRSQLVSLQWIPLALWCLHRFFSKRSPDDFVKRRLSLLGFVLFSVLLGLACFYYLQFYLIALAIIVPGYLIAYRSWRRPWDLVWLFGAFAAIGAPLLAAVLPYLRLFERYEFSGTASSYDLLHFFRPPVGSLLFRILGFAEPLVLQSADQFLGYAALGLGLYGFYVFLRSEKRSELRIVWFAYALLGFLCFFLAAGPEITVNDRRWFDGPFRLIQLIKPLANLRDPYRFSVLVRLVLAMFAAVAARRLVAGKMREHEVRGEKRTVLLIAVLALLVVEQWTPRHTQGSEIPVGADIPAAYFALADESSRAPIAELPPRPYRRIRWDTIDAYFSTYHHRKILVGKPSFTPPAFEFLRWELSDFPSGKSIALLQALGIEQILVHPKRWDEGGERERRMAMLARREAELPLIRRFPSRENVLWDRWELGGEELRAVRPAASVGEPRTCDCQEIERSSYTLTANGANPPELAVDGDRQTKWTTGEDQREGFVFEIRFDRPRVPVRIEFEVAFPYEEFARNLKVNGFQGDRFYRVEQIEDVWYTVALIQQLVDDPSKARYRYDLEAMEVDRLRLFIQRTEPGVHGWAIPEIHVYEPARND